MNVSTPTAAASQSFGDYSQSPILPAHLNLENFLGSLGKDVAKHELIAAREIATRIFETKPRTIKYEEGTQDFGVAMAIYPEVSAYINSKIQGKTVLEIGGDQGENAILMAIAGARRVIINDRNPLAIQALAEKIKQLPPSVIERIQLISCDCLALLKTKPELEGTIDFILCRNVIHFFTQQQTAQFQMTCQSLLKVGGEAIITANALRDREIYASNPSQTYFTMLQCPLYDRTSPAGSKLISNLVHSFQPSKEEDFSLDFERFFLYERSLGNKWEVNRKNYQKFSIEEQKLVGNAIKREEASWKTLKAGCIFVVKSSSRLYTQDNLAKTFERQFTVTSTFAVDGKGHLLREGVDVFKDSAQVGVIFQKQSKETALDSDSASASVSD